MSIRGFGLKPGTVDHVREYLREPNDTALASRLGVNRSVIQRARDAETTGAAADRFVGEAMRATTWPWQAFYAPTRSRAAA